MMTGGGGPNLCQNIYFYTYLRAHVTHDFQLQMSPFVLLQMIFGLHLQMFQVLYFWMVDVFYQFILISVHSYAAHTHQIFRMTCATLEKTKYSVNLIVNGLTHDLLMIPLWLFRWDIVMKGCFRAWLAVIHLLQSSHSRCSTRCLNTFTSSYWGFDFFSTQLDLERYIFTDTISLQ